MDRLCPWVDDIRVGRTDTTGPYGPLQIPMSVPHALPHHVALPGSSHGTFGAPTPTSHCLILGREDLGFLLQALSGFGLSFEKEIRVTGHREALSHFLSLRSSQLPFRQAT